MTSYIAIPLKKSSDVDLVKPLKNLIASYYNSSEEPVNYDDAIEALNRMRQNCTNKNVDPRHESTVEQLERYYDQLVSLETKCPPSEVQIPFKWKDALEKGGSFLLGSSSLTIASFGYEKMCILFNIAAVQSQIGASLLNEGISNDQSLRMAAKHFQSASGIYQALKHLGATAGGQELTADLHPDILHVLHLMMLAQAQEAFFYKAANDNMKDAVVAKIAAQCHDFYTEMARQMLIKYTWPDKDWSPLANLKEAAFLAIAEFYQGQLAGQAKNFGEQIARLTKSVELFRHMNDVGKHLVSPKLREFEAKANRALEEARKDNDFIYHAKIPDYKSLAPIGRAPLAKPTDLPTRFRPESPDLFEQLLPVAVQQAVHKIELRKQEIVNTEIATMRELTQLLNGTLASLNLPAAIEDLSGAQLPPSLKDKAAAIKAKGGLQRLEHLISELPELLTRNREILDETERVLKAEEDSDNNLRQQFGAKWTRTPSGKLNTYWKEHITKYRTIIQNAVEADNKVRAKFETHRPKIQLLATGSESDINRAIPSGSGAGTSLRDSQCYRELHRLMDAVEALKNEREVIESELKNASFNEMKSKFLTALAQDGAINELALSTESLGEVYGPLQKQVRDSKSRQEQIIREVQIHNEEFVRLKGATGGNMQRETYLSELAQAHDAYMELLANLEEGTKFYNDLTQLLVNLQNKVEDFCFARKAEREEICKDMQSAMVSSSATAPTPATPAYHQSPAPPRPPPPTSIPASAPTSSAPQPAPVATQAGQQHPNMPFAQPYAPNPYQPYYYAPPPLPATYNPYAGAPPQWNTAPAAPGYPPQTGYPPAPQNYPQQPYPSYPYPNPQ